jgi:hypothetical protein
MFCVCIFGSVVAQGDRCFVAGAMERLWDNVRSSFPAGSLCVLGECAKND